MSQHPPWPQECTTIEDMAEGAEKEASWAEYQATQQGGGGTQEDLAGTRGVHWLDTHAMSNLLGQRDYGCAWGRMYCPSPLSLWVSCVCLSGPSGDWRACRLQRYYGCSVFLVHSNHCRARLFCAHFMLLVWYAVCRLQCSE